MADQNLITDCKERVAYDLMKSIAYNESGQSIQNHGSRDYILTLYRQCYKAVTGLTIESVLKKD